MHKASGSVPQPWKEQQGFLGLKGKQGQGWVCWHSCAIGSGRWRQNCRSDGQGGVGDRNTEDDRKHPLGMEEKEQWTPTGPVAGSSTTPSVLFRTPQPSKWHSRSLPLLSYVSSKAWL